PAKSVSDKLPNEWEVVTCDFFKDWGACTITGFALTPFDSTSALFDHMLLGRTVADLDKATDVALGTSKPEKPLAGKERDALWADLLGAERTKAGAALRAFLSAAPDQVQYVGEQLAKLDPDKERSKRISKLIADLNDDKF